MPFQRPTLNDLQSQISADLESRLPGADSQLRRSFLGVLSRVLAGALHGLYGFLAWLARQLFPDTAEVEFLDRWAGIWGVARKPAWPADGSVTLTGTDGAVIPAGTELQRGDGVRYMTQAEGVIAGGTVTIVIVAVMAGAAGNATAGTVINLVAPIAGVQSSGAAAVGGLTQGSDQEADADLLARLLARIQQPPHGGAKHDYVGWAMDTEAHGLAVTRAWCYPQELGIGTVTVRFMMDDTYGDGIPLAADVTDLQAYIDEVRPVTADVTVVAPVAEPTAFEISGLNPGTQAVKDAIEAELRDLIRREAEPDGTIPLTHFAEAISIAAGEFDHALVSPAADVAPGTGKISTFGGITWS